MADDGFVELQPEGKKAAPAAPVVLRTFKLKHGNARVSFSFDDEVFTGFSEEGWPRFTVAYNPAQGRFRIAPKVRGPFEARRAPKGNRIILRAPLPKEMKLTDLALEAKHLFDGGYLYVTVPAAMRLSETTKATMAAGLVAATEAMRSKGAVAAAKAAVPAPKF
jgi:hypothetical protein